MSKKRQQRLGEVDVFLGDNCPGWFAGSGKIKEALIEFLCRMPANAANCILSNRDIVVIDGAASAAWVWPVICFPHENVLKTTIRIIVLRKKLREMPYESVVGEIAHEFAHVVLRHAEDYMVPSGENAQEEANTLARSWGFAAEIQALEREPVDN